MSYLREIFFVYRLQNIRGCGECKISDIFNSLFKDTIINAVRRNGFRILIHLQCQIPYHQYVQNY